MFTAKMRVASITDHGNDQKTITMNPVMDELTSFTKYTPSGKLEFMCTNPAVNEQVAVGDVFLLTFEKQA
jgi:hypothetical protein